MGGVSRRGEEGMEKRTAVSLVNRSGHKRRAAICKNENKSPKYTRRAEANCTRSFSGLPGGRDFLPTTRFKIKSVNVNFFYGISDLSSSFSTGVDNNNQVFFLFLPYKSVLTVILRAYCANCVFVSSVKNK